MGVAGAAAAQRGLVTRSQMVALGFSPKAIEHRFATGWLHHVQRGVFSVGSPVLQPWGAEMAALLSVGGDALLTHESAAAVWGLGANPSFVAITVIGRKVRNRQGVRVHEVNGFDIRDVQIHNALPVTTPARTLIDCAASSDLDRLLNEARVLKLVTDAEILAAMARCPGRTGVAAMRALLEAEKDTGFTRSRGERRLKRIIRASGIEWPIFNTYVEGVEADAYWPRFKVVIEVDGYHVHGHWRAFQRDRAKANKLVAAGYVVLRFTWHQLTLRPMQVAAEIARTLGRVEAEAG
jgi:very-short-patch-repair endonuclease